MGPFQGSSNLDCLSIEMAAVQYVAPNNWQATILRLYVHALVKKKLKQSHYRRGQTLRVPEG